MTTTRTRMMQRRIAAWITVLGLLPAFMEEDSCTDVRDQLRPLLAERIRQIDEKRARFDELRARLDEAEHGLATCPDRDDHCSTECVFRTRTTPAVEVS